MIEQTVLDAQKAMDAAVGDTRAKLDAITVPRLGTASFSGLSVVSYGTPTPLLQVAQLSLQGPREALLVPLDKSLFAAVVQAVKQAYPSWGVSDVGSAVRVNAAGITDAERKDLQKQAESVAAAGKTTIRNVLRKATESLDKEAAAGTATAAAVTAAKSDVTRSATNSQARIDEYLKRKKADLLEV